MKRKFKKMLFILGILLFIPLSVKAQEIEPYYFTYPTFEYDWTWNYRQAAYYYIVDLSATYTNIVKDASANWFKTGYHTNPLYPMTRTTIKNNSPMDFYNKYSGSGVLGVTNMFVKGGASAQPSTAAPPNKNWLYCTIDLNEDLMNERLTDVRKKVTVLHEMGHCFGLAHAESNALVMYAFPTYTTATGVTFHDSAALVEKLGGV